MASSRVIVSLLLAVGVVGSAAAYLQPGGAPPATPPVPVLPAQPPAPKPVPVPTGEVVKKTELEGGLIAEDLKIGDGYEIKSGGAVVAFYHGTLKDGKVFDSAFDRGEAVPFSLSGVIEGWQKGVPGMKVGGVRRLTIPAKMAYGEMSPSPDIPANSDLVFVIQVVDALQVEDVKVGEGEAVGPNCVCVTTHTILDKDGKQIEKTEDGKPYVWLPGEFAAMQFGLDGMKVGGKRKLVVPAQMNETAPGVPTTRPANVPLTIEVELVALRNLPSRRR